MHRINLTFLALLQVVGLSCGPSGQGPDGSPCGASSGVVERIIDGDTVDMADGTRIRYLLIDTPELGRGAIADECFAQEATERNEQLVLGQSVTLEYDEQCLDRYGRTLAYIYVGQRMINRILVEGGYATVLVIPPNTKHAEAFKGYEESAQQRLAGLWGACQ